LLKVQQECIELRKRNQKLEAHIERLEATLRNIAAFDQEMDSISEDFDLDSFRAAQAALENKP
jgi:uncharacterized protein YlxW (UPF0749 family)